MDNYWKAYWTKHAQLGRSKDVQTQVQRTVDGRPIGDLEFQQILEDIEAKMEVSPNDSILELCCGNGLIIEHLAPISKEVVGVDFVRELVEQIDLEVHKNVSVFVGDIRTISFEEESFDKVIMYAGLQYFNFKQTIGIFRSVRRWLKRGGLFYVGDIPDQRRMWRFFDSEEREQAYFDSMGDGKPIIGTWFDRDWISKLGRYAGFKGIRVVSQPQEFSYAHYRFDMIMKK